MKKIAILVAVLLLVVSFISCEKPEVKNDDVLEKSTVEDILEPTETNLKGLEELGWQKTSEGYVYSTTNEECTGNYIACASGKEIDFTVKFDYGNSNKEMLELFKEEDATKQVCSGWFMDILGVSYNEVAVMNYKLYVGDKLANEGSLTVDEAIQYGDETDND